MKFTENTLSLSLKIMTATLMRTAAMNKRLHKILPNFDTLAFDTAQMTCRDQKQDAFNMKQLIDNSWSHLYPPHMR